MSLLLWKGPEASSTAVLPGINELKVGQGPQQGWDQGRVESWVQIGQQGVPAGRVARDQPVEGMIQRVVLDLWVLDLAGPGE